MIPVEADLVIVDWSGIVHGAWHEAGPEGMLKRVAGELLDLLASPQDDEGFDVPRLVLAVDAGLPTHRHELTAALDAPRRYKANRTKKPREFWPMVDRLTDLVDALRIPTLAPESFAPQTWEADDAAATACRRARAAGLSVLLASRDKDWRIGVTDEAPAARWWSPLDKRLLDRAGVIGEHGVPPELLADWLALDGDSSDNVPGCEGIGKDKATKLLRAWPGIAALLAETPATPAQLADMTKGVERIRRERDKTKRAFGDASKLAVDAEAAAAARDLWAWLAVVHAHRADVELSRKLVELRTDVPIVFDADEALVGGWDVREVRAVLDRLGCGWLGNRVERRLKRAPRGRAEDARPEPRRGARRDAERDGDAGRPRGRNVDQGQAVPAPTPRPPLPGDMGAVPDEGARDGQTAPTVGGRSATTGRAEQRARQQMAGAGSVPALQAPPGRVPAPRCDRLLTAPRARSRAPPGAPVSRPAILLPPGVRLTTDATEPPPPTKRPEVIRVRWRRPARVVGGCRACGYPTEEHSEADAATCADVAREMAAEAAAAEAREQANARLWALARSVGK